MVTWIGVTDKVSDAGLIAEYSERVLRPIYLVSIDFLDENDSLAPLYANSSMYDITYEGNLYYGAGALTSIESVQEGLDIQVYGIKLKLSYIPPSVISTALTTKYRDRPCTIRMGLFDESIEPIVVSTVFSGWVDTMVITHGSSASVELAVENAMLDWETPCNFKYTHQQQIHDHPGDNGLIYASDMVDKVVKWGWTNQ